MTTALSILLSLGSSAVGRRLHRRGKLPQLFGYLRSAIYSCLLLAVVCVTGFLLFDERIGLGPMVSTLIVSVSVFAATSVARILEILIKLFTAMSEPEDRDG